MTAVPTPLPAVATDDAEIPRLRAVFDGQRKAFDAEPCPDLATRKARLRRLIGALQMSSPPRWAMWLYLGRRR